MSESDKVKDKNKAMEETDFGAEIEIDSSAPLAKIIANLLDRERFSKAYKLYLLLLVQRRLLPSQCRYSHFTVPGYPLKMCKENWDGEIPPGYFEAFQYKCTMPKVISQMRNIGKSDPVTDYMEMKNSWKNDVLALRISSVRMSQKRKVERINDEVIECPKYLIDLAAMLERDPDQHFDSTCNWYYAGEGNMHLICINWVDYLLHSDHCSLYLTRIHKEDMTLESETEANFNCKSDILETIFSPLHKIVVLRTMKKIIILKVAEIDNHLYFDTIKQFESEMPFTSVSFDKHHTNILYANRLDGNLSIVNLDRMKARSVKLIRNSESNLNNWNRVIAGERATYMHIDRKAISFYDKRTNGVVNKWTGVRNIVDEIHCNDIAAAVRCDDSPSLYFTTDHHVFLMDTRCAGDTKLRALQRWTHGLRCLPLYVTVGKSDHNKEFIVLASQWCKDTCVVSNYADSAESAADIPGVTMPYHPPHILDTLAEARKQMLCLDLDSPIDGRLTAATTGLAVTDQGDKFAILTHNSLGDVMWRTLYPDYLESFIEDDSVNALSDWSVSSKVPRKDFEVSSITDIANIWKSLKSVPDSTNFGPPFRREVFKESEIFDAFENEELIPELLDVWINKTNENTVTGEDTSLSLNLHYDESDDDD